MVAIVELGYLRRTLNRDKHRLEVGLATTKLRDLENLGLAYQLLTDDKALDSIPVKTSLGR